MNGEDEDSDPEKIDNMLLHDAHIKKFAEKDRIKKEEIRKKQMLEQKY